MGTEITLSLNGVDIDYGKNRYWKNHHWLFPPGSLTDITYRYANDEVETKPGFQTTLNEAGFRLRHLGYSLQETETKFDAAVSRWNRTADLQLTFEDFRAALTSIDFGTLTPADLAPIIWDFRVYVRSLLSAWIRMRQGSKTSSQASTSQSPSERSPTAQQTARSRSDGTIKTWSRAAGYPSMT